MKCEFLVKIKNENYYLYVSMRNWNDIEAIKYSQQEIAKCAKEKGVYKKIEDYILFDE